MLTTKLPTRPSPPKMSIFWSTPWPDDHYAEIQAHIGQNCDLPIGREKSKKSGRNRCTCLESKTVLPDDYSVPSLTQKGVCDPDWVGARKIYYQGENIRVFPHEFSKVVKKNLRLYIEGDETCGPSHELVSDNTATDRIIKAVLDGESRPIFEQALLDGCTYEQAMLTAMEMNITLPDKDYPPIGWYRIKPEYGTVFCDESELEETTRTEAELLAFVPMLEEI